MELLRRILCAAVLAAAVTVCVAPYCAANADSAPRGSGQDNIVKINDPSGAENALGRENLLRSALKHSRKILNKLSQIEYSKPQNTEPADFTPNINRLSPALKDKELDLILSVKRGRDTLSSTLLGIELNGKQYLPMNELGRLVKYVTKLDLEAEKIEGFFGNLSNQYLIDAKQGYIMLKGERYDLPEDSVLVKSYGQGLGDIYLAVDLLNKIWPLALEYVSSDMLIKINTPRRLPYELQRDREQARKDFLAEKELEGETKIRKSATFIPNDYKLFSKPFLTITNTIGYQQQTDNIKKTLNLHGGQDLLGTEADYNIQFSQDSLNSGKFKNPRLRLTRRAYVGDELPLGLKIAQAGDLSTQPRELVGRAISGRGIYFSTEEEQQNLNFDRVNIEGFAQPGWDAELYEGNRLIDYTVVNESGTYLFTDIPVSYGITDLKVVLYGPEGQVEERVEKFDISNKQLSPGQSVLEGTYINRSKNVFNLEDEDKAEDKNYRNLTYKRGLNAFFTPFGSITQMDTDEGERTYLTAGGNFPALGGHGQVEAYKELGGGTALDTRFLRRFKGSRLNLRASVFRDFESEEANFDAIAKTFEGEINVYHPVKMSYGTLGLNFDTTHIRRENDTTTTNLRATQSTNIDRLRLSNRINTKLDDGIHRSSSGRFSLSSRLSKFWTTRGLINYDIYPDKNISSARAELRYTDREKFSGAADITHNLDRSLTSLGLNASYDFGTFLAGANLNWDIGEGFNATLRTNTSLGPVGKDGSYILSSKGLTNKSTLITRLYLDKDLNSVFSEGDEPLEGVAVTVNGRKTEPSDKNGYIRSYNPAAQGIIDIELFREGLPNYFYDSDKQVYTTVLRRLSETYIEIPVINTGVIDGIVYLDNAKPHYRIQADPTQEFSIPPADVQVTSEDLFLFGTDLNKAEQTTEVKAALEAVEERGIVPTSHDLSALGMEKSAPPTSSSSFPAAVNRVRIGESPDKRRLVLDLSGPADYEIIRSGYGDVLVVDVFVDNWQGQPELVRDSQDILTGYQTQKLPNGTRLYLTLRDDEIRVLDHGLLEPTAHNGHRIFIEFGY
jgi:hypothetical protein